jgi:putative phage repressor
MKNEKRLAAVKTLIAENFNGNQTEFARAINKSPAQVNQWMNGYRQIGDAVAVHIEKTLELPIGMLDGDPIPTAPLPYRTDEGNYTLNPRNTKGKMLIEQLDIAGAQGEGAPALYDYPDLLNIIGFSYEQGYKLFGRRDASKIKLVSTVGDSMSPTIPSGATIFLDISEQRFMGDAIYFFYYRGDLYLKRLQKTPNGLFAKSDNKQYDTFQIEPEHEHEFNILGRYTGIIHIEVTG